MKYFKIFEIAYLVIAIVSLYEVVVAWNEERNRAYMFLFFALFSLFMFFFRRNYRKKFENRNKK
jgi:O-antigen ligase